MKIGFVGIGLMGLPMAHRLLDAGHDLLVLGRDRSALDSLVAKGASVGASISEIAALVDVFCACRVTPEQSLDIFTAPDGVIATGSAGLICVDFATIDPFTSRRIESRLRDAGIAYLDAPISGGPDGAAAGSLSVIVGGGENDVTRVKPLFQAIGKAVFHMGGPGTGVTAKLCNNMISITTHALLAQAMVLGVKSGIDARALYDVLRNSSACSRTLERVVPNHFLPRNFEAAATVETILKDLDCALELGRHHGVPLTIPEVAHACFAETVRLGRGGDDIASVIQQIEEAAGIRVGPA